MSGSSGIGYADDEWMEKYLEGEEPDEISLRKLIRKNIGHEFCSYIMWICL